MKTKILFVVLILYSLSSCTSIHIYEITPLKEQEIQGIIKGETSKDEIIEKFGQPQDVNIYSNNKEKWIYRSSKMLYDSSYYWLYGTRTKNTFDSKLEILFQNGIVLNYVYYQTKTPEVLDL